MSDKFEALQMNSENSAMSDAFDRSYDRLSTFMHEITLPDDAVGAVFALSGRLAGVELFEAPEVLSRLAGKLIRSWAMEAIEYRTRENSPLPSTEEITRFLARIAATPTEDVPAPGVGRSTRFAGRDLVGGALYNDERSVHVLAFSSGFATAPQ